MMKGVKGVCKAVVVVSLEIRQNKEGSKNIRKWIVRSGRVSVFESQ